MDEQNAQQPIAQPTAAPAASFCPNCGAATQLGGVFCGNCGTKLIAPESEQPAAEPVAELVVEPVAEPVVEPVAQPAAEPVVEPVAEPVAQPAAEPVIEQPAVEPIAQPVTQPVAQPAAEPAAAPATEPAAAPATEPVAQPSQPFMPEAQPAAQQTPFGAQPSMPQQPGQAPAGNAVPPMNFQQGKQPGGVGAMVCGVLAIIFGLLSPIVGVILGVVAIVLAKKGGGKAKIARICGIAGIVVSLIVFAIGMAAGLSAVNDTFDSGSSPSSSSSSAPSSSSSSSALVSSSDYEISSDLSLNADEQQAAEAVAEMFEGLKDKDAAYVNEIGSLADEGFYSELELRMTDCGLDPQDYAKGMLEGFDYEVSTVILDSDGTGWVGVDVDAKDIFDVLDAFNASIDELDASGDVSGMTDTQIKNALGEMLAEAVSSTRVTEDTNYAIIDVELVGDKWVVDMDSWDFEIDYMFGLV